MSNKNRGHRPPQQTRGPVAPPGQKIVPSLLDAMTDGDEYGSIVSCVPQNPELLDEVRRAIAELEAIRGRPCVCYVANSIKPPLGVPTAIELADQLPFGEMIGKVSAGARAVDVLLATPGGSAASVAQLVDALRRRFDDVAFILPAQAMSAGTLWALSGDSIWMTERAFLGPIDPQVPGRDGRMMPAQALLTLLDMIQKDGEARLAKQLQPLWTHVVLLKNLDHKELGDAISASRYVIALAAEFIATYKFREWKTHSSTAQPVTDAERRQRAQEIAVALCSHEKWKNHGHAISREVLETTLRLKIAKPEDIPGLDRAIRRLWALWSYTFERAPVAKGIVSGNYTFLRVGTGGT